MKRAGTLAVMFAVLGCQQNNPAYRALPDADSDPVLVLDATADMTADLTLDRSAGSPSGAAPDAASDAASSDAQRPAAITCSPDPLLLACFRFQGIVASNGSARLTISATGVGYVDGPDGLALSTNGMTTIEDPGAKNLDTDQVTIEAWVKPRSIPGPGEERAGIVDYERHFSLFIHEGGSVRCAWDSTIDLVAPNLVRRDTWASLACTVDASAIAIYLDGKLVAQKKANIMAPLDGPPGLAIGKNLVGTGSPNPNHFDGLIDNLRIWGRVRTPAEICAGAINCK